MPIKMAVLRFYSKTGFWPSYCQISTDLDKILHTYGIHLWTDLDCDMARGWLQDEPHDCFFSVILVTHALLYRDDGSPRFRRQTVRMEVRTDAIVKNSGIL